MPQQVEVNEAVGIGVKNVPTSIAALSYMMRNVQGDRASQTSHGRHKISEKLENVPSVPRFPSVREDKLGSDKRRGPVIPISTFTQHSQRLSTKSLITHLPCSPQSFTPTSSQAVPDLSLSVHPWVSLRFFLYLRPKVLS